MLELGKKIRVCPSNEQLLHTYFQRDLSPAPQSWLESIQQTPQRELALLVSKDFYCEEEEHNEPVWESYLRYYRESADALSNHPRDARLSGLTGSSRDAWTSLVDYEDGPELTVWQSPERTHYLRFNQEDRELPVHVALGMPGASPAPEIMEAME